MKARTFILTAGATFALAVPAANASIARSGLYQAQVHTVLAEKHQAAKSGTSAAELRALRLRGDALNRKYHVGPYASFAYPSTTIKATKQDQTSGNPASVAGSLSNTLKTPH